MKTALHIAIWVTAIALSLALDAPVARMMRASGSEEFFRTHLVVRDVIKFGGHFTFILVAVIVPLTFFHRARWRAGLFVLLCAATTATNPIFKWVAGRFRPFKSPDAPGQLAPFEFHPFPPDGSNLCFPSGHATLAFAAATALAMLCPRPKWWRTFFYAFATIVSVERFAENAHWLSDIVVAVALGIGGTFLVRRLYSSWKINLNDPTCRS